MNNQMDDRDDDVRLPSREAVRRSSLREESHDEQDREFTLSTGTVLGIFFALALVCAVFFGFGYSLGRKSQQNVAEANTPPVATASDTAGQKPTAGAPVIQSIPGYLSQSETDAANRGGATPAPRSTTNGSGTTVIVPTGPSAVKAPRSTAGSTTGDATPIAKAPALSGDDRRSAEAKPAVPPPVAVAPTGTGPASAYVQIAAVSHQEDADVLLSALKRRGYTVFARPGESDKLIHVQVGPFASRKDADAMRQKLLGDGYNAIVK